MSAKDVSLFRKKERTYRKTNEAYSAQKSDFVGLKANQVKLSHEIDERVLAGIVKLVTEYVRLAGSVSVTLKLAFFRCFANHCWVKHVKWYQVENLAAKTENDD